MTYVIAEPCIGQKDNSCVEVCPVDCIHPTPDEADYDNVEQLYIDPDECIDCDACVEACPVDACFAEDQLPAEWAKYAEINANYFKSQALLGRGAGPLPRHSSKMARRSCLEGTGPSFHRLSRPSGAASSRSGGGRRRGRLLLLLGICASGGRCRWCCRRCPSAGRRSPRRRGRRWRRP